MKNLPISPESKNPSSVRLSDEDRKRVEAAIKIIKKRYTIPLSFKLNTSNVLRIVLHDFVEKERHESA